jgi:hypothetical protein
MLSHSETVVISPLSHLPLSLPMILRAGRPGQLSELVWVSQLTPTLPDEAALKRERFEVGSAKEKVML